MVELKNVPSVSVILPVYNGEKFIETTIKMLCESTLKNIEIIVIDDESKDASYEIASMCAKLDERIKLYRKKNGGGVFDARNFGIDKAIGEYICFCDQDDVIELEMYERMYIEAKVNRSDVVMCSTGKLVGDYKQGYEMLPDLILNNHDCILDLILENIFINTKIYDGNGLNIGNSVWKCMIRKEFVKKNNIKFRRYINYEDDWLFLLDALAKAKNVITISSVLYYWRVNIKSESYSSKYIEELYDKNWELQKDIQNILVTAGVKNEYLQLYNKHFSCMRYVNLIENEIKNKNVSHKKKIEMIKVIRNEKNYKDILKIRKYYCKNIIRKKITLGLIACEQFMWAYFFLYLFAKIKMKFVNSKLWNKLEREMRGKS